MAEDIKTTEQDITEAAEVIEEIKNTDEDTLKETISKWYEKTRTDGMQLGAKYICYGVYAAIRKHTSKSRKTTLRDYQRCIKEIEEIIKVPLGLGNTAQNNSKEENKDDGTTEESSKSNS